MADPKAIPDMLAPRSDIPDFTTNPITVKVGTPSATFRAHEDILTASSVYFKAALAPDWKEGRTRTVDLPEDDAKSFSLYLAWLHTRRIHLTDNAEIASDDWRALFNAYALGDKLLDTAFKDAMTDTANLFFLKKSNPTIASRCP